MSVRHVLTILAVDDVARARAFYQAAFAWPVMVDVPVYVELSIPGGMRLGLYDRRGFVANTAAGVVAVPEAGTTATELYLYADDLDQTITWLRAAGARELSPLAAREWRDEAAYFADPDGNVVVVARPLRP